MAYDDYYFNSNVDMNGNHEVHAGSCIYLPAFENRIYIGNFSSCQDAIMAARLKNSHMKFDGCYYCCRACHTG